MTWLTACFSLDNMTPNNRLLLAVLAVALSLSAPAAHATLAAAATFDQKVENAAGIVLGKCVKQETRYDPSHRWILTYSTFEVEKTIKGIPSQQITVVTPGGQVGSIHQDTIGIPAFHQGAENVLFLKNTELGPTVLYFDQGAYDVTVDQRGERIVSPVPSNIVKIDTQRGMAVAPNDAPRTLSEFERDVEQAKRSARDNKMRMDALAAEKRQQETSFWYLLKRNRWIVMLALAGIAFATWKLIRR
jgi:hypothetical protein